ncbi:MAG TPA: hypothetical protein VI731_12590 [Bacteroidia bacterium]|nr:hypothetical protein [Bacteroidia bacterium]
MPEIKTISPRASFLRNEDELSIVITASADRTKVNAIGAILLLWLAGGAYVIFSMAGIEDQKTKLMMGIWIAFWLFFSYVMAKAFRWQQSGREILKVRDGKLFFKRDVGGRGWVHAYNLRQIRDLKILAGKTPTWIQKIGGDYWSTDADSIGFQYQDQEVVIGYNLTEHESAQILKLLSQEIESNKSQ